MSINKPLVIVFWSCVVSGSGSASRSGNGARERREVVSRHASCWATRRWDVAAARSSQHGDNGRWEIRPARRQSAWGSEAFKNGNDRKRRASWWRTNSCDDMPVQYTAQNCGFSAEFKLGRTNLAVRRPAKKAASCPVIGQVEAVIGSPPEPPAASAPVRCDRTWASRRRPIRARRLGSNCGAARGRLPGRRR